MRKFDPSRPRGEVTFQCRACRRTFDAAPARVEDDPAAEHHPFRYFALCAGCGAEVQQAPWDRALQKAWVNATGPTSAEGKAAVTANLEGHPTADETLRTRYNAMKNGLHAKSANYFPAKPDGYAFCKQCAVDREYCRAQPACVRQTEIFLLHHAAFDQKDPKALRGLYADLQAAIFSVLQQILQTIIGDGVTIHSPEYYTDKDGKVVIAEYLELREGAKGYGSMKTLTKIEKHPLFQPLGELLSRNNMSLADMGMTVKVIEAQQDDEMGRLNDKGSPPEALDEFRRRQEQALADLGGVLASAGAARERDPVLLEYHQESGEAKLVPPAAPA